MACTADSRSHLGMTQCQEMKKTQEEKCRMCLSLHLVSWSCATPRWTWTNSPNFLRGHKAKLGINAMFSLDSSQTMPGDSSEKLAVVKKVAVKAVTAGTSQSQWEPSFHTVYAVCVGVPSLVFKLGILPFISRSISVHFLRQQVRIHTALLHTVYGGTWLWKQFLLIFMQIPRNLPLVLPLPHRSQICHYSLSKSISYHDNQR